MNDPAKPQISLITLNYNRTADTIAFLESSRQLSYPNYEIIVCDMNSDQDPGPAISAGDYPHTRFIRSEKNLGFSGGNNLGIRAAKGEYLFIVNNDTVLSAGILELLLEPMLKSNEIAAVSPKILFYDRPDQIEYAGFNPFNMYTGRTSARGYLEKDLGQYNSAEETSGAHGCAMLIRARVLDETGGFPEKFFLYYEEWDLNLRIRKLGYKIWFQGSAFIYHKGSSSVGNKTPLQTYYMTRNRILLMRRQAGFFQWMVFLCFFTIFTIPKSIITYFAGGSMETFRSFVKGILWNLHSSSRSIV